MYIGPGGCTDIATIAVGSTTALIGGDLLATNQSGSRPHYNPAIPAQRPDLLLLVGHE